MSILVYAGIRKNVLYRYIILLGLMLENLESSMISSTIVGSELLSGSKTQGSKLL